LCGLNIELESQLLAKRRPSQEKLALGQTLLSRRKNVHNGLAKSATSLASQATAAGVDYDVSDSMIQFTVKCCLLIDTLNE